MHEEWNNTSFERESERFSLIWTGRSSSFFRTIPLSPSFVSSTCFPISMASKEEDEKLIDILHKQVITLYLTECSPKWCQPLHDFF